MLNGQENKGNGRVITIQIVIKANFLPTFPNISVLKILKESKDYLS
jgi:hypothetical protein